MMTERRNRRPAFALLLVWGALALSPALVAAPAFAEDDHAAHGEAGHGHDDSAEANDQRTAASAAHGAGDHLGEGEHAEHAEEHGDGHGDGHGLNPKEFGASVVNFLIYVALLVFFVRKPAAEYFAARRTSIAADVEAAKAAREAAEARLRETKVKLAEFDAERDALLAEFRELGEQERRRIVADAEAEAARIVRDAELAADNEVRRARSVLETRMVDLALELAEKELTTRLDGAAHGKLIDDGIEALARDAQG